jgi:hypothetical protein
MLRSSRRQHIVEWKGFLLVGGLTRHLIWSRTFNVVLQDQHPTLIACTQSLGRQGYGAGRAGKKTVGINTSAHTAVSSVRPTTCIQLYERTASQPIFNGWQPSPALHDTSRTRSILSIVAFSSAITQSFLDQSLYPRMVGMIGAIAADRSAANPGSCP